MVQEALPEALSGYSHIATLHPMKIILVTGIYPPDIGGPATYSHDLAAELVAQGHNVTVLTYTSIYHKTHVQERQWRVIDVERGKLIHSWFRMAKALRRHAKDADIVYAFSSVSCGIPILLSCLRHPKKVLRLGGDFFWERYTDREGMKGLREWYESAHWTAIIGYILKKRLLKSFHHIIFSTEFQKNIYREYYRKLPPHSVIENALLQGNPVRHSKHTPFRLLFMGRFVGFKNLLALVRAMVRLPEAMLTFTGEGPMSLPMIDLTSELSLNDRVTFISPVNGEKKDQMLHEHDLLIIPSITEISPNVALEARRTGMPVLLTRETGLSPALSQGMILQSLRTPDEIVQAVQYAEKHYESVAADAAQPITERNWQMIAKEHLALFQSLV